MHKLIFIAGLKETLSDWNEKIYSFTGAYMDNVAFAAALVIVVFIFGCWAISYFNKK